jgi:hypothetical protein
MHACLSSDHAFSAPWIPSEARFVVYIPSIQAAPVTPADPLPVLDHPIPRQPTVDTNTFLFHGHTGRPVTPPRSQDRPHPYLGVAEPGPLPCTHNQDSGMGDIPSFSPVGGTSWTPWDVGLSSTVPYQHQDRLHAAPIGGESQPTASLFTLTSQDEAAAPAAPASQAGAQRSTKRSRARSSDDRFPCDICGISTTRNWSLERHRRLYCRGPGGKRGRKPSKAPRKFDDTN